MIKVANKIINNTNPISKKSIQYQLYSSLLKIRTQVKSVGDEIFQEWKPSLFRSSFKSSALNLAYYIALRRIDLRIIQSRLPLLGLSSLGRCESRVLQNLDAIISTLSILVKSPPVQNAPSAKEFLRGDNNLRKESITVLGPLPKNRRVRIMATLPKEAAENFSLVKTLLLEGVNLFRINCAHGDREEWQATVKNIRRAEKDLHQSCRIFMDLAGPKLRTEEVFNSSDVRVMKGDHIFLAKSKAGAEQFSGVAFSCTFKKIFKVLKKGNEVWIDDGSLGCIVKELLPHGALLQVEHAPLDGKKIKPAKGLNFPGLDLQTKALTEKDIDDLDFVLKVADTIGYSFVQSAEDIQFLQKEIAKRLKPGQSAPPIVAKIETQKAVQQLPEIIIQAAGYGPFGVMIARGDLAVEIGYLRLAEIQEEILWLCEAAHTPVIWATQVLEKLTKEGLHSRAEMTDAVMGERAECVMLNKGNFLSVAVKMLSNILIQMEKHQTKKTPQLRALKSW